MSTGPPVVVRVWLVCDDVTSVGGLCRDVDVAGCGGW